jgi:CBS domain-containing protein
MRLADVLPVDHIVVPLEAETVRGAVLALVDRLVALGRVQDPHRFDQLVGDEHIRDVIHVGDRVLLPHQRSEAVGELTVALGIAPRPLRISAGGPEGREQIVVLVLAPPSAAQQYLQVVAALARVFRNDSVVERLVAAGSPQEVVEITELRDVVLQPRLSVRDVMTQRVYRVYPDTPVFEVLELMSRHDLKSVPVVGEKREVLGIVSERDLLRHLLPQLLHGASAPQAQAAGEPDRADPHHAPVREIMSRSVLCVSDEQTVADVASIMINKDVERVPVVSEGKLVGFLTRGDIIRKLYGQ